MTDIIYPKRKLTTLRIVIVLLIGLLLLSVALCGVIVYKSRVREAELQIELSKLKIKRLTESVDYQQVDVEGCTYLIFERGVVHAANCPNIIHPGNK